MRKVLIPFALISLISCSATTNEMQYRDKSPRGITIINIIKEKHSRAYQSAESHCAKYNKVPRVLKSVVQQQDDDSLTKMSTTTFECVRPSI